MDYKTEAQPKATAGGVPVFCAHDAIVAIEKLIPNPKNPNTHPDAQIQALGRIIRQTGWRAPITVSKRSGFIVKGHGRLAAAKLEGLTEVPASCAETAQTKPIALSYSTEPSLRSFSWIRRTAPEVFRNPDAAPEVSEPNATTQTGRKSK